MLPLQVELQHGAVFTRQHQRFLFHPLHAAVLQYSGDASARREYRSHVGDWSDLQLFNAATSGPQKGAEATESTFTELPYLRWTPTTIHRQGRASSEAFDKSSAKGIPEWTSQKHCRTRFDARWNSRPRTCKSTKMHVSLRQSAEMTTTSRNSNNVRYGS